MATQIVTDISPEVCPTPGKKVYPNQILALADAAAVEEQHHEIQTAYLCDPKNKNGGCGAWHNTSHPHQKVDRRPASASARINDIAADWPLAPMYPTRALTVGFYLLTPAIAAFWLANFNVDNRNQNEAGKTAYTVDMLTGGWDLNGDTLRFDTDGNFFDGQHRAAAVARSGKTVPIILVTGLDPQAQETTDSGIKRTFAQWLNRKGETEANHYAAAVMIVLRYKLDPTMHGGKDSLSHRMLQKIYYDHPEIRDTLPISRSLQRLGITRQTGALLSWLFNGISSEDHDDFFDKLLSGADLPTTSPIFKLRSKLLTNKDNKLSKKPHMSQYEMLGLVIKAWNHYRAGGPMDLLRFNPGGKAADKFPTPR